MNSLNMIGSDELSETDMEEVDAFVAKQTESLELVASESVEAREFLSSKLGVAVLKVIGTNKVSAMNKCTTATDQELLDAQLEFLVYQKVEQVFAAIIVGGDEAVNQLEQMRITT